MLKPLRIISIFILVLFIAIPGFAQINVSGLINDANGSPLDGVNIKILNSNQKFISQRGKFSFQMNASSKVAFSKSGYDDIVKEINSENTRLSIIMTEKQYNLNDVVIFGASKRLEKITESPAAINILNDNDIKIASRANQIGGALNGTPGVDVLLNGTTDYCVNTRGFNNGLNRRILVLQDGRDLAMPLLGAQEWNSSSLPLDEFSKIEFIKGPASALYGANCFNGVMALTSYAPKEVIGTKAAVTIGDYETFRADVRQAGYITNDLTYKVTIGRSGSLNLSNSRTDSSQLEYPGLKLERRPLDNSERYTYAKYGTIRFDYDLSNDKKVVLEGGYTDSGNELYVQPLGRVLVTNTQRPYVRAAYNSENINFTTSYMRRDNRDSFWILAAFRGPTFPLGSPLKTDDGDLMMDLQFNTHLDDAEKSHFIMGISQQFQNINTHNTTLNRTIEANFTGIYSQIDYDFNETLKFVASGRFDRTNVHESQFSPRVAIVINASDKHKFRFSGSSSFQRPNYSELYRYTPDRSYNAATINNLTNINNIVTDSLKAWTGNSQLSTQDLKLNNVRGWAVGNDQIKVEKKLGVEFGYQGIIDDNIFFTADIYYDKINDFIANFLPGMNSNIERWSAKLDGDLAQYNQKITEMVQSRLVGDDKIRLSYYNNVPTLIQSTGNFGEVTQYGVDLSLNWYLDNNIIFGANYSYYNFDLNMKTGDPLISSNSAPNKANISLQYIEKGKYDVKATIQYMDTYLWIAGATVGQVPAYTILNLNAGYIISDNVELGINIFNVFDTKIIQMFGGTYLPRLANAKLTVQI